MKGLAIAGGLLALLTGPACAQTSGFYVRADVGLAFGTWSSEVDTNPAGPNPSLGNDRIWGKMGTGAMFDVGAGYQFAPFLRFEGTIGYIPSLGFNGYFGGNPNVTARSTVNALVGLGTAYLDIAGLFGPLPGNIQPFILGGAGFANVNNGAEDDYVNGIYSNTFSGSTNTNVAWTAGAGIGVPITPRLTVDVTYRYLDLGERRVGPVLNTGGTLVFLSQDRADLQVHSVMIGLRFAL